MSSVLFFITTGIPFIALICYAVLLTVLYNVKKDKLIITFIIYIFSAFLWALCSFMMRMQPDFASFWNQLTYYFIILVIMLIYFLVHAYLELKTRVMPFIVGLFGGILLIMNTAVRTMTNIEVDAGGLVSYDVRPGALFISYYVIFIIIVSALNILKVNRNNKINFTPIIGTAFSVLLFAIGLIMNLIPQIGKFPFDILFSLINSVVVSHLIFTHKSLKFRFIMKNSLLDSLGIIVLTISYVSLILILEYLIRNSLGYSMAIISIVIALVMAVITQPIMLMFRGVSEKFFKKDLVQHEALKSFNENVLDIIELDQLAELIISSISKGVNSKNAVLFIHNKENENFNVIKTAIKTETDLSIPSDHEIIQWFERGEKFLHLNELENIPFFSNNWQIIIESFEKYGIQTILPISKRSRLLGLLMLTQRNNNKSYEPEDIDFATALLSTSAVALENSDLYERTKLEAITDGMTGLYNYRYFTKMLNLYFNEQKIDKMSIMMIDIDNFKMYNDLNGHQSGDMLLMIISDIMRKIIGENGLVFRYGGEEFAVIMPHLDGNQAMEYAEKIRSEIENHFINQYPGNNNIRKHVTISLGLCDYPLNSSTSDELVKGADISLYISKKNGKNRCIRYNDREDTDFYNRSISDLTQIDPKSENYSVIVSSLYSLAAAIDVKDHYTYYHSCNVAIYAAKTAKALGLDNSHCNLIYQAGTIHDIGKIGISDQILNKKGELSKAEYEHMKQHVDNTISIVKHSPALKMLIPAIYSHHERWDGQGYPRGIKGEDIPFEGRILSVVDAFDSMVTKRPYRHTFTVEEALGELERGKNIQFDAKIVDVFVELVKNKTIIPNLITEGMEYTMVTDLHFG